jgi:hypothetical protein
MGKTSLMAKLSGRFDDIGRESMGERMIRTLRRHYPNENGQTLLNFTGALLAEHLVQMMRHYVRSLESL